MRHIINHFHRIRIRLKFALRKLRASPQRYEARESCAKVIDIRIGATHLDFEKLVICYDPISKAPFSGNFAYGDGEMEHTIPLTPDELEEIMILAKL